MFQKGEVGPETSNKPLAIKVELEFIYLYHTSIEYVINHNSISGIEIDPVVLKMLYFY